jgi:hypothetical protein
MASGWNKDFRKFQKNSSNHFQFKLSPPCEEGKVDRKSKSLAFKIMGQAFIFRILDGFLYQRGGKVMKKLVLITLVLLLGVLIGASSAVEVTLFGPNQYLRTSGKPNLYKDSFPGIAGKGKLIVVNGDKDDDHRRREMHEKDSHRGKDCDNDDNHRVSSALISVNGRLILGPKDFNQEPYILEVPISLRENNSISVELRSEPGSYLMLEITKDISLTEGAILPPETVPQTTDFQYTAEDGMSFIIEAVTGRVILQFDSNVSLSNAENIIRSNGGNVIGRLPSIMYYVVDVVAGNEMTFITNVRQNPHVVFALPDVPTKSHQKYPNEWASIPTYLLPVNFFTWHLIKIKAPFAWEAIQSLSFAPKQIAVIDKDFRGIDEGMYDFQGRMFDTPVIPDAYPDNYHGTKVSAIIGATGDNGFGNVGVDWKCGIILILNYTLADLPFGIVKALNEGASVINLSQGGLICSQDSYVILPALFKIVRSININGAQFVIVNAAGNESCELTATVFTPAKPDNLLLVGATDSNGAKCDFSNFGSLIDIAAPGTFDIYDYSAAQLIPEAGTSFSAPLVAGAATLLWSKEPNLIPQQVVQRLKDIQHSHLPGQCQLASSVPVFWMYTEPYFLLNHLF